MVSLPDFPEGACVPIAAKVRWPQINQRTKIRFIEWGRYQWYIPIYPGDVGWAGHDAAGFGYFQKEEIDMWRLVFHEPILTAGYGPRTNTLLLGVARG